MMQFPTPGQRLRNRDDHQQVTPELIAMAFEVILEGYVRLEQKSPGRFQFEEGLLESLQQQKSELVQYYFHQAKARQMDQLAAFRFIRYDLRERLQV